MSLNLGLELKSANCASKCSEIFPKKLRRGALVSGFGSKQPLQQQSTPACFIGPV